MDQWQLMFLGGAALFVLLQAWRGWRLGAARQLLMIGSIAAAYAAAYFGGRFFVPLLRPLGFPDQVLAVIGGALLAVVVFAGGNLLGALLFKRTADQKVGMVRLGYGLFGAILGALFALVLVWVAVVGIRVLGTVAETEIANARAPVPGTGRRMAPQTVEEEPSAMVRGLAHMKHSLEQGTTGAIMDRVDPVPEDVYIVLHKVGQMMSSEESVARFLAYPGIKPLAEHPKITALQRDPQIARDVLARNYMALLRNERIVEAANDPEISKLLRNFEFQKALDYALVTPEKRIRP